MTIFCIFKLYLANTVPKRVKQDKMIDKTPIDQWYNLSIACIDASTHINYLLQRNSRVSHETVELEQKRTKLYQNNNIYIVLDLVREY